MYTNALGLTSFKHRELGGQVITTNREVGGSICTGAGLIDDIFLARLYVSKLDFHNIYLENCCILTLSAILKWNVSDVVVTSLHS